jgi:hypothetical protein
LGALFGHSGRPQGYLSRTLLLPTFGATSDRPICSALLLKGGSMVSETLEHLAIPVFEEANLSYDVHNDGQAITVMMTSSYTTFRFVVIDYAKPGLLIVECWNITRFEPRERAAATQLANELNRNRPGKFSVDKSGALDYAYELSVKERTTPEDFADAFDRAIRVVDGSYETIMKARWSPKPRNGSTRGKRQDPSKHEAAVAKLIEEALHQED